MMNDTADISIWLNEQPFKDNAEWNVPSGGKAASTLDDWLNKGREIPGFETLLIKELEHGKEPVNRSAAALALGYLGQDRSTQALIKSLQTDIPSVAMEAAASLGRLGKSEAIEPLCDATKNTDANIRANACTALGSLGGEKARSCLENAAKDSDSFVQQAANEALMRIE